MSTPSAEGISTEHRARLRELADALIPAADGMPAASEVGVADGQLDRVLAARPDLSAPLRDALARAEGQLGAEWLARLADEDAPAYEALLLAVVGGYYTDRDVRRRLGYQGQEPLQVQPEIVPSYVEEGLLDGVLERGPIYRQVPDG